MVIESRSLARPVAGELDARESIHSPVGKGCARSAMRPLILPVVGPVPGGKHCAKLRFHALSLAGSRGTDSPSNCACGWSGSKHTVSLLQRP